REDDESAARPRVVAGWPEEPDGLARDGDGPYALLRLPPARPGHDLRVPDPAPALHRPGPGLLQRDAEAGAPRRGRDRLRRRLAARAARKEHREPAQPAEEPAGTRLRHPGDTAHPAV